MILTLGPGTLAKIMVVSSYNLYSHYIIIQYCTIILLVYIIISYIRLCMHAVYYICAGGLQGCTYKRGLQVLWCTWGGWCCGTLGASGTAGAVHGTMYVFICMYR